MKLQSATTPVEIQGQGTTSNFSIAMNGKAFRVLSDTLYSNKIGSIVRELSCNAYDAHIMKGNPEVAFEIHLPDAFEPWFSVKDYGVGLSPEAINTVFTVYFQSTKDQSNDTIGAFGLGAKTPFSYTDQFTVTSVHSGKRTIYSAYITESGVPSIAVMHSEDSDEHTGVEIKMSAKQEDYSKFAAEVKQQLMHFKTKPVVLNGFVQWPATEYTVDTPNVKIAKTTTWNSANAMSIVQGNVGYPINVNNLEGKPEISASTLQFVRNFSKAEHMLCFDIGQIGVTASREGIEYNKETLINIEAKVQLAIKELNDYIEYYLIDCKSDYDRMVKLNTLSGLWHVVKYYDFKQATTADMVGSQFKLDIKSLVRQKNGYAKKDSMRIYRRAGTEVERHSGIWFTPEDDLVIVLKDKPTLITAKCEHMLKQYKTVVEYTHLGIVDDNTVATIKEVFAGFDNIVLASSINLPKVAVRTRSTAPKATYYKFPGYYNESQSVATWIKQTEELKNVHTACYIVVEHRGFDWDSHKDVLEYVKLSQFDEHVLPLIAVTKATKLDSRFVPLSEYIEDKKQEYAASSLIAKYERYLAATAVRASYNYAVREVFSSAPEDLVKKIKVMKYLKVANTVIVKSDGMYKAEKVYEFAKVQPNVKNFVTAVLKEQQKFPLLKVYDKIRSDVSPEHLIKYVVAFSDCN